MWEIHYTQNLDFFFWLNLSNIAYLISKQIKTRVKSVKKNTAIDFFFLPQGQV